MVKNKIYKLPKTEIEFYNDNRIPIWECKFHEEKDLGVVFKNYDDSYIRAIVQVPRSFWKFEIFCAESGKLYKISTGRGYLSNYLPIMKRIATGIIIIDSFKNIMKNEN